MSGRIKVANKEDRTWRGIVFQSKHEMEQYVPFTLLERSGIVTELKRQVRFPLVVNGSVVTTYIADWTCKDLSGNLQIYDAKGMRTELYQLKYKLFHALHKDLRIIEL